MDQNSKFVYERHKSHWLIKGLQHILNSEKHENLGIVRLPLESYSEEQ